MMDVSIADNITRVRERMARAAERAGRGPDEIALMAVTKTFPPAVIREAYQAGQRLFGENRVQEFEAKRGELTDLPGASFHLIGHLQSNKAGKAAEIFDGIDSVDSVKLLRKLDDAAGAAGKKLPVLIEVNVGGEAAKAGADPESVEELIAAAAGLRHIEVRGLMAIPPFTENAEDARPYFRRLQELRIRLRLLELSMGMSHDFEVAIEEGATCVRIGTAIFGERSS